MKNLTLYTGLLIILSIFMSTSCKKDDDDDTRYLTKVYDNSSLNEEYQWQGNQLQKINNYNSQGEIIRYQEFKYSDGKLAQLDDYSSTKKNVVKINKLGYNNLLDYNNSLFHEKNRLKGTVDPDANITLYSYSRYKYLDGKVNKVSYYTKTNNDLYVTNSYDTIEYNGTQISKYKRYWDNEIVSYVTFTWGNDNVTSENYFSNQNGNFVLSQKIDYQYDDKINKYKAIMNLPLIEPEILSKNNQISAESASYFGSSVYKSAISIAYQYNSDNYPTQQTETDADRQNELKVYSFEYR